MMVNRGWKSAGLFALLVVAALTVSCSVLAGNAEEVDINMASATVESGSIDVDGYAMSFLGNLGNSPSTPVAGARNVLLLHGAKYSAQTWQDLGTLSRLAGEGYRVAAVNLPTQIKAPPRDELLELMCLGLGMGEDNPAVIVSPSMSGSFSVPLLLRKPSLFAGYVPVAPGVAKMYQAADFAAISGVPALIIYGEKDLMGGKVSTLLASMPGSKVVMIEGATHPAYLDAPEEFHSLLLDFLGETVVFQERGPE